MRLMTLLALVLCLSPSINCGSSESGTDATQNKDASVSDAATVDGSDTATTADSTEPTDTSTPNDATQQTDASTDVVPAGDIAVETIQPPTQEELIVGTWEHKDGAETNVLTFHKNGDFAYGDVNEPPSGTYAIVGDRLTLTVPGSGDKKDVAEMGFYVTKTDFGFVTFRPKPPGSNTGVEGVWESQSIISKIGAEPPKPTVTTIVTLNIKKPEVVDVTINKNGAETKETGTYKLEGGLLTLSGIQNYGKTLAFMDDKIIAEMLYKRKP